MPMVELNLHLPESMRAYESDSWNCVRNHRHMRNDGGRFWDTMLLPISIGCNDSGQPQAYCGRPISFTAVVNSIDHSTENRAPNHCLPITK